MRPLLHALAVITVAVIIIAAVAIMIVWSTGWFSLRESVRIVAYVGFIAACAGLVGDAIVNATDNTEDE